MTDMENFDAEFARIAELNNPPLVSQELHKKSDAFKTAYHALRRKMRNDKYRANNKEKINENRREKYKAKREAEITPIIATIPKVELTDVNLEIKREKPAVRRKNDELSDNTKTAYIRVVKKLYKHYKKEELPENDHLLKYLNGVDYNTTYIWKNHSYIIENAEDIFEKYQSEIPHLYSVFSKFRGKKLPLIAEKLYPLMTAVNKNYADNRGKDVYVNEDAVKKVSFDRADVLENLEKLTDPTDRILYALTFLLPTRRLSDYRKMIWRAYVDVYVRMCNVMDYNWIDDNYKVMTINTTKNKNPIIIEIDDDLSKELRQCWGVHISSGTYNKWILGKPYTAQDLSKKYERIMNHLYGFNFGAQDIRRIYCTKSVVLNISNHQELINDAVAVGHSLAEHIAYCLPNTSLTQSV